MALEKTWRWFGANDAIKLTDLQQMGIEGVVTALHHIKNGDIWTVEEIMKVKTDIEKHGMRWSVVESLPVTEGIKLHSADYDRLISNYHVSLRNLGKCGIDTVCYNFMPVLDWTRTNLHYTVPCGGEVMYFNYPTFVAFDVFILKRPGADKQYPADVVAEAEKIAAKMSEEEKEQLVYNIIVATQGFVNGSIDGSEPDYKGLFLNLLDRYAGIDKAKLREHFSQFLKDVIPVAEEAGVRMCVHPDDPSFPLLGLPRIVSNQEDLQWVCDQVKSPSNGITFCTGSLSTNVSNNLAEIAKNLGPNIHFAHLRNNKVYENKCFYESGHLDGTLDMFAIVRNLILEQKRRIKEGRTDTRMPFRPDHGMKMLDDFNRQGNPGYPLIGRMRGLNEINGLMVGVERSLEL